MTKAIKMYKGMHLIIKKSMSEIEDNKGAEVIDLFGPPVAVHPLTTVDRALERGLVATEANALVMRGHLAPPDSDAPLPFRGGFAVSRTVEDDDGSVTGVSSLRAIEARAVRVTRQGRKSRQFDPAILYILADKLEGRLRDLKRESAVFENDDVLRQLEFEVQDQLLQHIDIGKPITLESLKQIYEAIVTRAAQIREETANVSAFRSKKFKPAPVKADLPPTFEEFLSADAVSRTNNEIRDAIDSVSELIVLGELEINKVVLTYRLQVKNAIIRLLIDSNGQLEDANEIVNGLNFIELLDLLSLPDNDIESRVAEPMRGIILTTRADIRVGELKLVRNNWAKPILAQ